MIAIIIQNYFLSEKECMDDLNSKKEIDMLNDSLFSDVKLYTNDEDGFTIKKLGINKCIEDPKCETCVEFGISGTAFCFPKYEPNKN